MFLGCYSALLQDQLKDHHAYIIEAKYFQPLLCVASIHATFLH